MFWTTIVLTLLFFYFILTRLFIIVEFREEVIQERLGKFKKNLKPGFHFLVPFIDRPAYRREMREQVLDVPIQTCITKDNIEVAVDGLVYIKVMDAYKASYGIADYQAASINLAQTTMRSEIGKITLDDTFSEREKMNENIVREIDKAADPWGIKVLRYELKNIRPSNLIIDTMEKQMEAEREKRAEITHSEGFRQSRINESEGEQQSQVLISEGARQRRINEAVGKAKEIELVATATAKGIQRIADAMQKPGGELAVRTKLIEQYINEFGNIVKKSNISVLPTETANLKTFFEGVRTISTHTGAEFSTKKEGK